MNASSLSSATIGRQSVGAPDDGNLVVAGGLLEFERSAQKHLAPTAMIQAAMVVQKHSDILKVFPAETRISISASVRDGGDYADTTSFFASIKSKSNRGWIVGGGEQVSVASTYFAKDLDRYLEALKKI